MSNVSKTVSFVLCWRPCAPFLENRDNGTFFCSFRFIHFSYAFQGPHFNYTYYITITGIVGSVVNFVSVILYQAFMSTWRFRPALIFTIVIGSLAPIVDLVIVMRWNEAIGISDEVFFLLGNAIFENLVVILLAIPMSAIYAKVSVSMK